jgi:hypothetical protein
MRASRVCGAPASWRMKLPRDEAAATGGAKEAPLRPPTGNPLQPPPATVTSCPFMPGERRPPSGDAPGSGSGVPMAAGNSEIAPLLPTRREKLPAAASPPTSALGWGWGVTKHTSWWEPCSPQTALILVRACLPLLVMTARRWRNALRCTATKHRKPVQCGAPLSLLLAPTPLPQAPGAAGCGRPFPGPAASADSVVGVAAYRRAPNTECGSVALKLLPKVTEAVTMTRAAPGPAGGGDATPPPAAPGLTPVLRFPAAQIGTQPTLAAPIDTSSKASSGKRFQGSTAQVSECSEAHQDRMTACRGLGVVLRGIADATWWPDVDFREMSCRASMLHDQSWQQ